MFKCLENPWNNFDHLIILSSWLEWNLFWSVLWIFTFLNITELKNIHIIWNYAMRETRNTRKKYLKEFLIFPNNVQIHNRLNTDYLPLVFPLFGILNMERGGTRNTKWKKVPTLKLMMSILTSEPKISFPPFLFQEVSFSNPTSEISFCEAKCD